MERVVVVGCAGSGKSTFARRLASVTGLPAFERDALGEENSPKALRAMSSIAGSPRWIFDGHPYYAEGLVFDRADTVVIFDYPLVVVLWRVLRRTLRIELTGRPVGAHHRQGLQGLREAEHPLRWALSSHRQRHQEGIDLAARLSRSRRIIHLRRPQEAARFLAAVQSQQLH